MRGDIRRRRCRWRQRMHNSSSWACGAMRGTDSAVGADACITPRVGHARRYPAPAVPLAAFPSPHAWLPEAWPVYLWRCESGHFIPAPPLRAEGQSGAEHSSPRRLPPRVSAVGALPPALSRLNSNLRSPEASTSGLPLHDRHAWSCSTACAAVSTLRFGSPIRPAAAPCPGTHATSIRRRTVPVMPLSESGDRYHDSQ